MSTTGRSTRSGTTQKTTADTVNTSQFRDPEALNSDSDDQNAENVNTMNRKSTKSTKHKKTATSTKRQPAELVTSSEDSADSHLDVTPPKLRKSKQHSDHINYNPVVLLTRLSLNSPPPKRAPQETVPEKPKNKFQNARKTLSITETYNLPGREKELQELSDFLNSGLDEHKSASMYISGQPGTGKTACLSKLLKASEFTNKFKRVYVNCTSISSIGSIYKKVCEELKIKVGSEKECLTNIERYLTKKHKIILMVLDEIDQLVGKKQSVLYTIFEWPALANSNILLIGIANSLDLTDRLLSRLHAKCNLKPRLMNFAPYSKQQITEIFRMRLEEAQVLDIFPPVTIQLLSAKVASISGDVRRALDIGRRVIEMAEEQKRGIKAFNMDELGIGELDARATEMPTEKVEIKQVMQVLNQVYGAAQTLGDDLEDTFPLQQKILICTILLILKRDKNKDITVGRLYGIYAKVCGGRNIQALGQSEFGGLCELVETRGILRIIKNKEPRMCKVQLQWDEDEVTNALKDKQLIASILADTSCITNRN